jgi:hypothetical protein
VKAGYEHAEIGVVQATFGYRDVEKVHEKDRYRASLRFHLADRSEKRPAIRLVIRIESATGAVIDRAERTLRPEPGHRFCFVTPERLRISSRAKKPPEGKAGPPGRALVVKPGSSLVVYLDRTRFAWPVPLASERKRGTCDPADEGLEGAERGGRGR